MAMNEFEKALVYAIGATFRFDFYDEEDKPTGMSFPGDVSSLSANVTAEKVERKAHTRGDDGSPPFDSVIGTLESERTLEYSLTFGSWTDKTFATYFFGNSTPFTQAGGAISPLDITVGELGVWQAIGDNFFIDSVRAENASGTELAATDFEISPRTGLIRFMPGGSVSAGDIITVTPTLAAVDGGSEIGIMGRKTPQTGRMIIDMFNRVSGQPRDMLLDLRKVTLTPSGNADMMTTEFMDLPFTMAVQYDNTINPATGKPYGYGRFILGQHPRA